MREYKLLIEYDLQFFADGPGGEKTEPATSKKLDDARKDGKVAKSKDLVSALSLLSFFLLLKFYAGVVGQSFIEMFSLTYNKIPEIVDNSKIDFNTNVVMSFMSFSMQRILIILIPILLVAIVIAFVANVFQVKWKITTKPLEPKFDKFNPVNGFKRIFSMNTLVDLVKNIAMMGVIVYVVYSTIKDQYQFIFVLYEMSLVQAVLMVGDLVISLGIKISVIFLVIGLADYLYQKFKFNKDMMMTKQEIKDEYKQTEGDPQIKGQRKQKMREMSRRRMMSDLPKADVVITNPTHFAVALQYDTEIAPAPRVIAKGADYVAFQIREKAKEYDIDIVENRPLARLLYNNVEIGEEIPQEVYQTVAEILALIYSRKEPAGNVTADA